MDKTTENINPNERAEHLARRVKKLSEACLLYEQAINKKCVCFEFKPCDRCDLLERARECRLSAQQ